MDLQSALVTRLAHTAMTAAMTKDHSERQRSTAPCGNRQLERSFDEQEYVTEQALPGKKTSRANKAKLRAE